MTLTNITSTQSISSTSEDLYVAVIMVGVVVMTILVSCLFMWTFLYYFRRDLLMELKGGKVYHYQDENEELDAVYGSDTLHHVKINVTGVDDTGYNKVAYHDSVFLFLGTVGGNGVASYPQSIGVSNSNNMKKYSNPKVESVLPDTRSAKIKSTHRATKSPTIGVKASGYLQGENKVESAGISSEAMKSVSGNVVESAMVMKSKNLQSTKSESKAIESVGIASAAMKSVSDSVNVSAVGAMAPSSSPLTKSESKAIESAGIASAAMKSVTG